ncbi:MAG: TetR/AcrR family transcriptional regulator, partial [Actinomycetota bacterium]|nr:TetR/AcrR family transcriptional regulator [Actinomycetota bacterium]
MARVDEATKSEHRRRLLDAAAAEFASKGLDGARVDDISVAAGLAKGTIYNYFDSKVDIFRAVVEEWARRTTEVRVVPDESSPVRDQLLSFVQGD